MCLSRHTGRRFGRFAAKIAQVARIGAVYSAFAGGVRARSAFVEDHDPSVP
jgi:hypothetical protein